MIETIRNNTNKYIKKHEKTVYFKGSNETYNTYLISEAFQNNKNTVFVVLSNLYEAQKYYDKLSQLNNPDDVLFYPTDQILTSMMALGSPEFKSERLYTLNQLLLGEPYIVVMTMDGLTKKQLSPIDYINSKKTIIEKQEYSLESLVQFLIYSGYKRSYTVEKAGEFSLKGSILDVFTLQNKYPYRLDFFGDELEEIKIFDPETQRSFSNVERINIEPMHELFYTEEIKDRAINKINNFFKNKTLSAREQEKLDQDIEKIELRRELDTINLYIPFFNDSSNTIIDFVEEYDLFIINTTKMEINLETTKSDLGSYQISMHGDAFLQIEYEKDFYEQFKLKHINIEDSSLIPKDNYVDLNIITPNEYRGDLKLFYLDIKEILKNNKVVISITSESLKEEVTEFIKEYGLKDVILIDEPIFGSFWDVKNKLYIIDESNLFHSKIRPKIKYRSVINQAQKIRKVEDLTPGDFVVHYDYGIGQYIGLKTMKLGQEKRDYLHIIYANEEALYVPMDQIDLVLKYSSHDGIRPKLSKMGGKMWSKTKANVRMKIKDLSDRLINLYAQRQSAVGFAFDEDDELMNQFENDFIYEPTKDQQRAIQETKFDMESTRPMDRLICGDVGFGKTEVALRASFKAVLNQKQVMYLVPTTVLARQHYYTFKERFDKYGANVALLSRFVTNKQVKETLEKLKKGFIDVVIGTHRLLSDDVQFNDLGLLIIDEEQRFGVEHKERIREIKTNVDTLTLSATPIPRTLQMSLMGLKDLTMIETPPLNRYPVQTYVVERHDGLIKEAIHRELARGGQVFYLFNRVQGIQSIVKKLEKLVPEAKIASAHGKMNRNELEYVLSDFIDHTYDVLVATTIIETGLDIPNTNTLIIHDADKLGLSQLYQIRGRVGRSDRIAYAYLLYEAFKNINDEAKKRLAAIKDFTALGSGFKIAMRDLSIRGAGDVLGAEQSGFIDSVGLELYTKLVEEAVTGVSLEREQSDKIDEVFASRHVDPVYINDDSVRIEIHKRIASLNRLHEVDDLKDELTDRFGNLSADLLLYMYERLFKKLSHKLGVEKTNAAHSQVTLVLSREASKEMNGAYLFERANNFHTPIKLGYFKGNIHIIMDIRNKKEHWLYLYDQFLDDLLYNRN